MTPASIRHGGAGVMTKIAPAPLQITDDLRLRLRLDNSNFNLNPKLNNPVSKVNLQI